MTTHFNRGTSMPYRVGEVLSIRSTRTPAGGPSAPLWSPVTLLVGRHSTLLQGGSSISHMKVATGKIVGGKVILDGADFAEGATVTVLAREDDESFEASPELESALLKAIDEVQRGDAISGESILARLRNRA